ncbi:MAG: hypothetical protein GY714_20945 [Desulfobacterales bacterium]|nr:hypothetical protein [Desulfobacterales bacterium]
MADLMTGEIKIKQKGAKKTTSAISNSFKKIAATAITLYGVKKAFDFISGAIKSANEQLKINALMSASISNSYGLQGEELNELTNSYINYSTQMAYSSKFYDEEIAKSMQLSVNMGVQQDQMKRVTQVIIDMSTALDMDLKSATRYVNLALGGQVSMLKRYGVELDATGDIVEQLSDKFGGMGKAAMESGANSLQYLKKAVIDLKEGLGIGIIQSSFFQETMEAMTDSVTDNALTMEEKTIQATKNFMENIRTFVDGLVIGIYTVVGNIQNVLVGFVSGAIAMLATGMDNLRKAIMQIPVEVFQFLGEGALAARDAISGNMTSAIVTLKQTSREIATIKGDILSTRDALRESSIDRIVEVETEIETQENLATSIINTNNQIARSSGTTTQRVLADLEKVADKVADSINGIINLTKKNLNSLKGKADEIMSGTASKLMEDATTTGTDVGMTLGQNIFSSLEAMSGKGNTEVMDIIWKFMKSLIKMALDKFMDTVSGGLWGFVGGLVGSLFGVGEVAGGGAMVVNNINAMDVESFREYNYSYGQQSELQGWL